MSDQAQPLGRREARKQATRAALQQAADRLFAERGFAGTTVQDIAESAGVTERTFFRYFAGKEDLVLEDALAWLPALADAIRARPARESPLVAVERALIALTDGLDGSRPNPSWLFVDGPPAGKLRTRQAGLVLRSVERAIADALRDRLGPDPSDRETYRCATLAACALAAMRSALIRDWQLRQRDDPRRPVMATLIRQAFGDVRASGR